jgi:hypothetical protein
LIASRLAFAFAGFAVLLPSIANVVALAELTFVGISGPSSGPPSLGRLLGQGFGGELSFTSDAIRSVADLIVN